VARSLRIQFPGAFYHVTCRGIERRDIFADDKDRHRFLTLLSESLETYQVALHAYVMMTDHFHLLMQTEKANCSEFMRHFNIRYTRWFNYHHDRCGNLYQGRYHAYLIDADSYLLEVSRYVHLNPVRVTQMKSLSFRARWQKAVSYPWSSLAGYVSARQVLTMASHNLILSMVGGQQSYRNFVVDGLIRGIENPFSKVRSRIILGCDDFVTNAKWHLGLVSRREQPSYRELVTTALNPEAVFEILERECGISRDALRQRRFDGGLRGIAAELLYRYCDITQTQIGSLLGEIDYVSVNQLRRRLKKKMAENTSLRERYEKAAALIRAACIM